MSSTVVVCFCYFFQCLSEVNYGFSFLILSCLLACLSRLVLGFRWLVCYAMVSNLIPLCITIDMEVPLTHFLISPLHIMI